MPGAPRAAAAIESHAGDRAVVLYVEDHPADVALMVDFLGGFPGLCAGVAATLDEAVDVARRVPPSVVLLDVELVGEPGGFAKLERLRALPEMTSVPVIALSGTAHPRARALARQLGVHRFVTKPIDLAELGDALSSVVPSARD